MSTKEKLTKLCIWCNFSFKNITVSHEHIDYTHLFKGSESINSFEVSSNLEDIPQILSVIACKAAYVHTGSAKTLELSIQSHLPDPVTCHACGGLW